MRLISTVADYLRLAKIDDHASRLQAWTADYEAAHPDVFDVYYSSYSDPSRRDSAVADAARISPLVREWEARAEALARKTEQEFRAHLSTASKTCFAGITPRRPLELLANSVPE